MIVSPDAINRACLAIRSGNIRQNEFETHYCCQLLPHPVDYRIEFDDDKSAVEFLLRFA
jgi:hypothetical protein